MAVSFGGMFGSNRVTTDENSILAGQWGQDGSNIKNLQQARTDATGVTIYTVSANKRLFINQITLSINGLGAGAVDVTLRDGGAAGPIKWQVYRGGTDFVQTYPLSTPIYFDTDVYMVFNDSTSNTILLGWEQ